MANSSDRQRPTANKNLVGNPNCALFIIDPGNSFRTVEVRAEAEVKPDRDKATVRKLANAYGVDEAMLVNEQEDRYTIAFRPRRIVVNPPAEG